jgi:hypothetical protein
MTVIIGQRLLKCNNSQSHSSDVSLHPTNSSDLASRLLNNHIRKNIEAFFSHFSKQEIEVFKYLMYYWNKFGNVQIPITNLCHRFKLEARRIHYLLKKLITTGVMETLKKGHTGMATKRAVTERGLMLWKAISKGFGVVKNVIHKTCADSCADSPSGHTNYISTKVDKLKEAPIKDLKEEVKKEPETPFDASLFFKNMKEMLSST